VHSRGPAQGLREHALRTIQIAVPVSIARMGILLLVTVDTAMTGRAGVEELAWYALAMAPQIPMLLLGIGMLMGTLVLGAQSMGGGREQETGHFWRVALGHALFLGLLFALVCVLGEPILLAAGQEPGLAAGGGRVLTLFSIGLPAVLMPTATSFFLESTGRATPGMVVMVLANLLNIALNWIFIYGNLGAPARGAEGAALATSLVRWFMFASLAGYALFTLDRLRFGLIGRISDRRRLSRRLRAFGYPMGLAHTLESAAFASMTLFAGLGGADQVAGFQVAFNILAMVFMCAIGLGAAASIRVGNAAGRGDWSGVRAAGWTATALSGLFLGAVGMVMGLMPDTLAELYTSDMQVLAVAVPCVLMAAFAVVPDGMQGVLMGALRGAGDVWPATALYCVAFWGVMVPVGWWLGVREGGGAPALTLSVFLGTLVATVLLTLRFRSVSRSTLSS
jgi:MATE family multidrug resistance protein